MTKIEELVAQLTLYLPASLQNQALRDNSPTGPGTLKGFKAKVAEVFRLGMTVGWDKRAAAATMDSDAALLFASNMLRTMSTQESLFYNENALRYAAKKLDQLREEES